MKIPNFIFPLRKKILYNILLVIGKQSELFKTLDSEIFRIKKKLNALKGYTIKKERENVQFNFSEFNIILRKKSSDFEVLSQIFGEKEYEGPFALIKKELKINSELNIIDAGANIGLFTIYANSIFKNSKFILIEPFEGNMEIIKKNLAKSNLNDAKILQNVISSNNNKRYSLNRSFRDGNEWSFQFQHDVLGKYISIDLESIILNFSNETINILKIDIEGAEFELFLSEEFDTNQLKYIKSIILEIHEDVGSKKELILFFEKHDFKTFDFGETTVFIQK